VELNEPEISDVVRQKADSLGFAASRLTLEIQGLCQLCQA
jgi:Fe2+ or Zn2+ uptake regulation protein